MSEENLGHLAVVKQFLDPRSKYLNDPYAIAARSALLHYAFDIAVHDPALSIMLQKIVAEELERERSLRSTTVPEPKEEAKTGVVIGKTCFSPKEYGVLAPKDLPMHCPRCDEVLSPETEYCPECGLDMYLV